VTRDYCLGAIMVGHEGNSSFIVGMTRYWDKLVCAGYTRTTGSKLFLLIYDAKGPNSWVVYRLKGATIRDLRG
jgi:hypothetical protein